MEGQFPLLWCENRRINGSGIKPGVKNREAMSLSKVIISPSAMTKARLYKADWKLQFLLQKKKKKKWTSVLLWWHSQLCNNSIYVLRAISQCFLPFVFFFWATNILTTMLHTSIITAVRWWHKSIGIGSIGRVDRLACHLDFSDNAQFPRANNIL